ETLPLYCHVSSPLRVTDPSSAALHTLSLHDALPICLQARRDVEESSQTRRLDAPGAHLQPEAEALAHPADPVQLTVVGLFERRVDRKSTRLNSSHVKISYAVLCLEQKRRGPAGVRPE